MATHSALKTRALRRRQMQLYSTTPRKLIPGLSTECQSAISQTKPGPVLESPVRLESINPFITLSNHPGYLTRPYDSQSMEEIDRKVQLREMMNQVKFIASLRSIADYFLRKSYA